MTLGSHSVVNLSKIASKYHGNIESVQYTSNLDNGSFVNLGANITDDVIAVSTPATATLGTAEVLLVASPEITYYAGQTMKDFYNPANQPARAYHLRAGDMFEISQSAVTGTIAAGNYVSTQNNSVQLNASTTAPANKFVGVIVSVGTIGAYRDPSIKVRVISA